MRFTPSNTYLQIANGASKTTQWDVFLKTVGTLSASLTAGSWTSVSNYVIGDIPDLSSKIEYELGQFTSNNVTLEMHTVSFWKTFFVPTYTDYYECKIQLTLKDGNNIATDGVTAFSGFIDTNTITYDEFHDKTTFLVRTFLDTANSVPSETLLTRYIANNPSSICANSLAFQNAKGLYLDTTQYAYQPPYLDLRPIVGIHYVTCGAKQNGQYFDMFANFDDGPSTPMPDITPPITYPVYNRDSTQVVLLSHDGLNSFPITGSQSDTFVVLDRSEILPWQWPTNQNEKQLLEILLPKIGATQVNFDNLSLSSYDNSRRYSIISNLTNSVTSTNNSTKTLALAANQSNSSIYYGFGNNIYEYSLSAQNSSTRIQKILSLTAGQGISKMIWDDNWNDLWFIFGTSDNSYSRSIGLWRRTTGASATTGNVNAYWYNFEVMDNDLTNYNAIYADATLNKVMTLYPNVIVGDRLTVSAAIAYGTEIILDTFACQRNGNYFFYPTRNVTDYRFSEVFWDDGSGRWVSSGQQANLDLIGIGVSPIQNGMYNGTYNQKDGIVYWDFNYWLWDKSIIYANQYTVGTVTSIATYTNNIKAGKLFYDGGYFNPSKTYFSLMTKSNASIVSITGKNFTNTYGQSATSIETYYDGGSITACGWSIPLNSTKDVMYGLDEFGMLFKHSPEIEMYINKTNFNNKTLFQILQQLLNQYNLIAVFRSDKSVYIYRRSDQGGTPVTTGNTFQINTDKTSQVIQKVKYVPAYDEITVSNNSEDAVYNGTDFTKIPLGIVKKLNVSSDLLPTNILKDLAYNLYQFYSVQRDMLSIELAGVTRFEYETGDNCNVDYSDTNINENITGPGFPIYNITYMENGNMSLDVLI